MPTFVRTSLFDLPAKTVFRWHLSPGALRALIPPWERVSVEIAPQSLVDGAVAVLAIKQGPLTLRWVASHQNVVDRGEAGGEFTDVQSKGPFARWTHRHVVESVGDGRSQLTDHIEYDLPLSPLSDLIAGGLVRRKLDRMFTFRHQQTAKAAAEFNP